jgi:hypothetical protein
MEPTRARVGFVDVKHVEIVGQALCLPNRWQAMRLPYKSFRQLCLSALDY